MINDKAEQVYIGHMRSEMAQFLPTEYSKVLEIGCNIGNFRQYVDKSSEYWGIEPSEQASEIAKTKMDKVLVGFYDKVANDIPDSYFDLVIANDIIEHMERPWDFLKSIKRKMNERASLVLSIPNVRHYENLKELLFEREWKYVDAGILDITHLRFFTEKSIIRLLNENEFEIKKMEGINPLRIRKMCSPIYWLLRLILGSDIKFLQFGIRAIITP